MSIENLIEKCYMAHKYENPGMENGMCAGLRTMNGNGEPCDECKECEIYYGYKDEHEQKMTNADRIRAMSDEELLDFICSIETYDDGTVKIIEGGSALCSVTDVENWLQSEVEE